MKIIQVIIRYFPKSLKRLVNWLGWHPLQDFAWSRRKLYEPQTRLWMEKIVAPGWICADVGANIGIITDRLAEQVGTTGMVIAFEPHPENCRRLKKYNKKNIHKGTVKVENIAITDGASDYVWLYPGRDRAAGEWNICGADVNGRRTQAELKVPALSLDDYWQGTLSLNFVKIDVEGAAGLVLSGMKRILENSRPVVFMEFHTESEWSARTILTSADYNVYNLDGELISPDKDVKRVYLCFAMPKETGI